MGEASLEDAAVDVVAGAVPVAAKPPANRSEKTQPFRGGRWRALLMRPL